MNLNTLYTHLDTIQYLNEEISKLLNEQDTPNYPSKKVKYIIIGDDEEVPDKKNNYISLSDAKELSGKDDLVIGVEIELDTVEWKDVRQDVIKSNQNQPKAPLSQSHLASITALAANPRNIKRGGKLGKFVVLGVPKTAGKILTPMKTLKKIFRTKLPHSICWCARLFDEHQDGSGDPDKESFENSIGGYSKPVRKEFLKKWGDCNKFNRQIKDKDDRVEVLNDCGPLEEWGEQAQSVIDTLLQELGQYFTIKGRKDNKGTGVKNSVAQQIANNRKINIYFTLPDSADYLTLEKPNGSTVNAFKGGLQTFKIRGVHKGGSEGKTVILSKGGHEMIFSFTTSKKSTGQSGEVWYIDGGVKSSHPSSWKGQIDKFIT